MISSEHNKTIPLIDSTLTLSNAYADVGQKICTKGLDDVALWIAGNLNTSDKINFRIKCYMDNDSLVSFYPQTQIIDNVASALVDEVYEVVKTGAFGMVVPLGISDLAPYIQIEAKVGVAGVTPAQLTTALVSFNRS